MLSMTETALPSRCDQARNEQQQHILTEVPIAPLNRLSDLMKMKIKIKWIFDIVVVYSTPMDTVFQMSIT